MNHTGMDSDRMFGQVDHEDNDEYAEGSDPLELLKEMVYEKSTTVVKEVFKTSDEVKNVRTLQDILTHLMTEVGELAQEIEIAEGKSYKLPGKDGIVGEAIDIIACVLDIVRIHYIDIDEDMLLDVLRPKLQKWKDTVK